jgi:hypothetical protein
MKTITSLRFILSIIAIAAFMLIIKSCKKINTDTAIAEKTELARQDVIKAIKEQYGDVSRSVIIPVNKEAGEIKYRDVNANSMVNLKSSNAAASASGILAPCWYNCTNATSAGQLRIFSTLTSVQRTYYVQTNSSGYKNDIIVNLEVSLPFTPLNADPGNPANLSNGSILITPPFGPSYGNNNITPIAISYISADPACSANNLYKISYTWSWVTDDIDFTNGYQVDVDLDLYNDCSLVGNFVTIGGFTSTLAGMMAACDRTDNVWTPGGGPGGCIIAAGNYITIPPPSGWAYPDLHQLEYRAINNANYIAWEAQSSTIYYGQPPSSSSYTATFSSTLGFVELRNMVPSSGNWIVRFRNIKSPTCVSIPATPPTTPPFPSNDWPGNWAYRIFNL